MVNLDGDYMRILYTIFVTFLYIWNYLKKNKNRIRLRRGKIRKGHYLGLKRAGNEWVRGQKHTVKRNLSEEQGHLTRCWCTSEYCSMACGLYHHSYFESVCLPSLDLKPFEDRGHVQYPAQSGHFNICCW